MIPEPLPPEQTRDRWTQSLVPALLVLLIGAGTLGLIREAVTGRGETTGFDGSAPEPQSVAVSVPSTPPVMRATATPEVAELRVDLDGILPDWSDARWSILVVSLDRGDTLFSHDPDLSLVPASNMKLVTTAAALHHLGPNYRFRTWAMADAPVTDGRLEGDLVLFGTGDPGNSDRLRESQDSAFEELARQLRSAGVRSIAGDVVVDGGYFSGPMLGPDWDPGDLNESFAAPVSAVTYNENIVTLQIAPSIAGRAPAIAEEPEGGGFAYRNNARTVTGRPRPRLWLERLSPNEPIRIEGEIQTGGATIWRRLTVAHPELFAARGFLSVLEAEGITVDGDARTAESGALRTAVLAPRRSDARDFRILGAVESPPLVEYLRVVNHVSHNLFAEAVFKTVGRVVSGEGSFSGGARVVQNFLDEVVGVSPRSARVLDGSGLSSGNIMSAGAFVRVLQTIAASDDWEAFEGTLPVAGQRNGLRRMYRTAAAGNLRAKTGTIEGVSSLSGVVRTRAGERLLFSILVNDVRSTSLAKRVEDEIGARLAGFRRPFQPPEGAAGGS